jgi:hypothetical protein
MIYLGGDSVWIRATVGIGDDLAVVSRKVVETIRLPIDAKGRGTLVACPGMPNAVSQGTVRLLLRPPHDPASSHAKFHVVEDLGAHQALLSVKMAIALLYLPRPADIPGSAPQRDQGGGKKDEAAISEPPRRGIIGSLPSNSPGSAQLLNEIHRYRARANG